MRGSTQTTFANPLDDKELAEIAHAVEAQLDATDKATDTQSSGHPHRTAGAV